MTKGFSNFQNRYICKLLKMKPLKNFKYLVKSISNELAKKTLLRKFCSKRDNWVLQKQRNVWNTVWKNAKFTAEKFFFLSSNHFRVKFFSKKLISWNFCEMVAVKFRKFYTVWKLQKFTLTLSWKLGRNYRRIDLTKFFFVESIFFIFLHCEETVGRKGASYTSCLLNQLTLCTLLLLHLLNCLY